MAAQSQLFRWTLPALAIIIGLFWFKRRSVERGDPGGKSNKCAASDPVVKLNSTSSQTSPRSVNKKLESASAVEQPLSISSPRKLLDNQNSQIRRSPPQPIIFTKSVVERHHRSAEWHQSDDDEIIQQLDRTDPVLIYKSSQEKKVSDSQTNQLVKMAPAVEQPAEPEKTQKLTEEEKSEEIKQVAEQKEPNKEQPNDHSQENTKRESETELRSQVEERDSANHSPVSALLEGSVTDEVRSEGSTDSGKGGSIKGHAISSNQNYYDFYVPNALVGRLIGRHGSNLQTIRSKSGAKININKKHTNNDECSICLVEGTPEAIQLALAYIRKMFPDNRYPNFTMAQLPVQIQEDYVLPPGNLTHLSLVENINNDIYVCHVVAPNRFFVQLPTHPSFPALTTLDDKMTHFYNNYDSPPVPAQLIKGQIVAVCMGQKWMRALIEDPDPEGIATTVRLLDYGGFWNVSHSFMRKIRNDYLTLPFQAIEVHLANIKPINPDWDPEAVHIVNKVCSVVGQAQVVGYIDNYVYVNLFFNLGKHGLISLSEELVMRNFAVHVPLENMPTIGAWQ